MAAQLDPHLVEILACPTDHHAPLRLADDVLVCTECGLGFPVVDGVPVLLIDEAIPPATGS